jgi:hypothetical protein
MKELLADRSGELMCDPIDQKELRFRQEDGNAVKAKLEEVVAFLEASGQRHSFQNAFGKVPAKAA